MSHGFVENSETANSEHSNFKTSNFEYNFRRADLLWYQQVVVDLRWGNPRKIRNFQIFHKHVFFLAYVCTSLSFRDAIFDKNFCESFYYPNMYASMRRLDEEKRFSIAILWYCTSQFGSKKSSKKGVLGEYGVCAFGGIISA